MAYRVTITVICLVVGSIGGVYWIVSSQILLGIQSVIGAYVSNFAFWIIAMIASIANHKLSFLARYDASNPIFLRFNQYYNTGNTEYLDIIGNVIYTIILSGVILGIVCAFRKRWEKNGI